MTSQCTEGSSYSWATIEWVRIIPVFVSPADFIHINLDLGLFLFGYVSFNVFIDETKH